MSQETLDALMTHVGMLHHVGKDRELDMHDVGVGQLVEQMRRTMITADEAGQYTEQAVGEALRGRFSDAMSEEQQQKVLDAMMKVDPNRVIDYPGFQSGPPEVAVGDNMLALLAALRASQG